jgi:5'-nucleotidase
MSRTILVDMDGVVADLDGELIKTLRERKLDAIANQVKDRKEYEYSSAIEQQCRKIMAEPGFFLRLPPIEGAVQALNEMKKQGHCVWFCSSPLKEYQFCLPEKYKWVEQHFGIEWTRCIMITPDKSLAKGHYLIDDKPEPKSKAYVPEWKHIVFDQSYNRHITYEKPHLVFWKDWQKVIL